MTPGPRDDDAAGGDAALGRIRLDRWLHHARVFKTRTLAAGRIEAGGIRVNAVPCRKPAHAVAPGDVVTIGAGPRMLVLRVVAPGLRRGPPAEARTLYEDLTGDGTGAALEPPGEGA